MSSSQEADFKNSFSSNHFISSDKHLNSTAVAAVKWAVSRRTSLKHYFPVQNGTLYCVCHKSTYSLPDDYNCKVELAVTSDGRLIVFYHPAMNIPYEHTKPMPQPDPVHNNEKT